MKKLSDLKPNPRNPRKISDEKRKLLLASLAEFGDLSGVIFNRTSGTLEGGHQRTSVLPSDAQITIDRMYEEPTSTGTVAEGRILINGESFSYREVEWDETKAKAANIAANKSAGDWNLPLLIETMNEIDAANFNLDLTMWDSRELDALLGGSESEIELEPKEEKKEKIVQCPNCGDQFDANKAKA